MRNWTKKLVKWLRILHRDLGYFVVGISIVYGVSGIVLNHMKKGNDPAYKTIVVKTEIRNALTISAFTVEFRNEFDEVTLKKVIPSENRYQLFLDGGLGTYFPETGALQFEVYEKKPIIFFFNKLHYNQKSYWTVPADFYAGVLIFLALSGLFMVRGKNGFMQRGKWYVMAGVILVLIYIWL